MTGGSKRRRGSPGTIAPPRHPRRPATPLPAPACRNANGSLTTATIRRNMQKIMQNNAAVFRTQESLQEGCQLIDECVETYQVGGGGARRGAQAQSFPLRCWERRVKGGATG